MAFYNGYSSENSYLAAINSPDIQGTGCDYDLHAVILAPNTYPKAGLPQCIVSRSAPQIPFTELIPKGVSPNGDGINDTFDLAIFDVKHLSIFNRYGEEVYSFTNYTNQWIGQDETGSNLPSGVYYYVLELADEKKTGWIYVNR